MFEACVDEHLAPFDSTLQLDEHPTRIEVDEDVKYKKALEDQVERIAEAQRKLYAHDRYSVLLIFQAMDAAGKDSTIRAVMSGVNPAGCQVFAFKKPSSRELDHDFLWRTSQRTPERGRIGVFNRSQYEEVLVVRVHPELLEYQRLPHQPETLDELWQQRYESLRDHELHLARNGVVVLKFFLNVSREEQRRRFLSRLEDPDKQWKFAIRDLEESDYWPQYMDAYEDAINATSRPWAPWYVIPADHKPYMRLQVATTIAESLDQLDIHYPKPAPEEQVEFDALQAKLRSLV